MRRQNLAPETLDGIEYGMRLAADPTLMARQKARAGRISADHALIASLSREALIDGLIKHYPAYIRDLLAKDDLNGLRDRVVMTLQNARARPSLLAALGIQNVPMRELP